MLLILSHLTPNIPEEYYVFQWLLTALEELLPSFIKCGITHPACIMLFPLSIQSCLFRFLLPFSIYLITLFL